MLKYQDWYNNLLNDVTYYSDDVTKVTPAWTTIQVGTIIVECQFNRTTEAVRHDSKYSLTWSVFIA